MANRDLNELTADFKIKVEKFLQHCQHAGYPVFITEGYRPQERQNDLYAQGRTTRGNVVTWTTNSLHTQRIAVDIAFNGSELYPSDIKIWEEVIKIAKQCGIDSGYDMWGRDLPHFQDNGQPLQDIDNLNTYKMNDSQKQLLESAIYVCKNAHNYGTEEMKTIAAKHAAEWRSLQTNS